MATARTLAARPEAPSHGARPGQDLTPTPTPEATPAPALTPTPGTVTQEATPAAVSQLQAHGEYLYWLDRPARTVYRVKRPAANTPPQTGGREVVWSGGPSQDPAGFTLDSKGVVYVTDGESGAILSVAAPGSAPQVVYAGPLLREPASIAAVGDDRLYVADNAARKILAFHLKQKEVVEEYSFAQGSLDHLLVSGDDLIAIDTNSKALLRFILDRSEHTPGEAAGADWRLAEHKGHATFGRGVRINLDNVIDEVMEVTAANGILYLLDLDHARAVLMPQGGGELVSIPARLLAEGVSAIAATEESLYVADGGAARFRRLPALTPVILNFVGDWTAEDVVAFYEYLRVRGLLPTKVAEVARPTTLEAFIREQGIMPTGYIENFQVLFCRLNPSRCTARQGQPLPENVPPPAGYAVRLEAGQSVVVPDLHVSTYTERRNITLPLDRELYKREYFGDLYRRPLGVIAAELAPRQLQGEDLAKMLRKFNPDYAGPDLLAETEGSFSIPIRAGQVRAVVPRADLLSNGSFLSLLAGKKFVMGLAPSLGLKPMAVAAVSPPPFRFAAEPCEPLASDMLGPALELVKHCQPGAGLLHGVPTVGIIDNVFNAKHRAFGWSAESGRSALQVYTPPPDPDNPGGPSAGPPEPLDLGGADRTSFKEEVDHGTYIAAIIGARQREERMVGLLPESDLYGVTVAHLNSALRDEKWDALRLFNVSLGEEPATGGKFSGTEQLMDVVATRFRKLFVISAGNELEPVRKGSLASLGYLDNVLVVGATNVPPLDPSTKSRPQPGLLELGRNKGSNYHDRYVSLVAPGQAIRGALYPDGRYGTGDGTSPAAAFVTSAAAALMVIEPNWAAWQVKFRLVATADLWTSRNTVSDKVFAGELNIKRALLDTKNVVIELPTRQGLCRGSIPPMSLRRALQIRKPGEPLSIPFSRILRVSRHHPTSTDYTVIYYTQPRRPDALDRRLNRYLEREVSVKASDLSGSSFTFNVDRGETNPNCKSGELDLISLLDFINTFTASPNEEQ
ncbi:MAG TPA: S8 family serine peptidase [Pyrinomonadaceae bacterium]|nr:S8 family serine peptidase [Pyrinomonadaceae bacterium]